MKISFLIRFQNEEEYLGECIQSILDQVGDFEYQFIFINDNTTDKSFDYIEKLKGLGRHEVDVLNLKVGEFTYAHSLNVAIPKITGDFVLIFSPHASFVTKDSLKCMMENFADDKVACVFGRLIPRDFADTMNRMTSVAGSPPYKIIKSKEYFYSEKDKFNMHVYLNLNGCSCVRTDILRQQQFRYRELPMMEDLNMGRLLVEAGYRLVYEPQCLFFHSHRDKIKQLAKRFVRAQVGMELMLFKKCPSKFSIIKGVTIALTRFLLKVAIKESNLSQRIKYLLDIPVGIVIVFQEVFGNYPNYYKWERKYLDDISTD